MYIYNTIFDFIELVQVTQCSKQLNTIQSYVNKKISMPNTAGKKIYRNWTGIPMSLSAYGYDSLVGDSK